MSQSLKMREWMYAPWSCRSLNRKTDLHRKRIFPDCVLSGYVGKQIVAYPLDEATGQEQTDHVKTGRYPWQILFIPSTENVFM